MRFSRFAVPSVLAAGAVLLAGCNYAEHDKKDDSKAAAGMVSGKKESCTEGSGASCKGGDKASMGAVSEKKAGCCGGAAKSECSAPATTNN